MQTWQTPPSFPALTQSAVHVWFIDLLQWPELPTDWQQILSPHEKARGERLVTSQLRHRYFLAHYLLRRLLAHYVKLQPAAIEFTYSAHGKPALANEGLSVYFNLSHSDDGVLIAITELGEVGCDIESTAKEIEVVDIAKRFFSIKEYEYLTQAGTISPIKFLQLWTLKEAYVKALGLGLGYGLNKFTILPAQENNLQGPWLVEDATASIASWYLETILYKDSLIGSVAVAALHPNLHTFSADKKFFAT